MKNQKELSSERAALIISTAVFFDALQAAVQLIPVLGQVLAGMVALLAFMTLWLACWLNGIKFTTAKRASTMGIGFLIELIPILNILPAWTLATVITLADAKKKSRSEQNSGEKESASR